MAAYARQAVARSSSGWTVSGNTATLFATTSFPAMASGAGGTVTHFGVGRASSGTGELLFFGTVSPNLVVGNGVTAKLDTGTTLTQDAADGFADTAATDLLKLILTNVTWANVGDATGLVGSSTAGSLYLSLHTSSPGTGGTQSTNELAYS